MAKATRDNNRKTPKSRVLDVELSEFEVRRKKEEPGKKATMRDYAKMEWTPWVREPDMHPEELAPNAEVMRRLGVQCRMSYAVMLKSKAELMEMFDTIDDELADGMMADILKGAEVCKDLAHMWGQNKICSPRHVKAERRVNVTLREGFFREAAMA